MVQVQRLTVEIARRFPDFEEFLDLGMRDVEIARRRATPQRPLRNRERQRVHHTHERNDAAGLAIQAHRLADAADIAPISADAAPARRQPHILVPGVDDPFQAVGHRVQIAADRQPPPRAAIRQHGRRRHEPKARNIVIEPLGMRLIVGIGRRHAHEKVLIGFAGQQIAVLQRFLAEIGEQRVARMIDLDRKEACMNALRRHALGRRRARHRRRRTCHGIGHKRCRIRAHALCPAIIVSEIHRALSPFRRPAVHHHNRLGAEPRRYTCFGSEANKTGIVPVIHSAQTTGADSVSATITYKLLCRPYAPNR